MSTKNSLIGTTLFDSGVVKTTLDQNLTDEQITSILIEDPDVDNYETLAPGYICVNMRKTYDFVELARLKVALLQQGIIFTERRNNMGIPQEQF